MLGCKIFTVKRFFLLLANILVKFLLFLFFQ